jgi:ABC-2 type transport system permease protein
MAPLKAELLLLLRSRISALALILLFVLTALAVASGLSAVARQNAVIERVVAAQAIDRKVVEAQYGKPGTEAGNAAYYTFHLTTDPPSSLAFAAIGQRDIQPYVLRVRLLGLQSQLYESETFNPELALPGPFDFAFVLIYLAPLVIVALMHDLITGEREAGRLRLLQSLPPTGGDLWLRRTAIRYGLVLLAMLVPLVVGAMLAGAGRAPVLLFTLVSALYLAVWFGISLAVAARGRSSAGTATALVGCWIALTLLIPAGANAIITRALPVAKSVELTLAQREAVHRSWDIPKDEIFQPFFQKRPEWRDTPPVTGRFHWKWYYAMHEVGDDSVAGDLEAYRTNLAHRQTWTGLLGWITPAAAVQTLVHRLADTDLPAHLAYQDSITAFHDRLRVHLYPYVFNERTFELGDFARLPTYAPRASTQSAPVAPLAGLGALTVLALFAGWLSLRRMRKVSAGA